MGLVAPEQAEQRETPLRHVRLRVPCERRAVQGLRGSREARPVLGLYGRGIGARDLVRWQREANEQADAWMLAELQLALMPTAPDVGFRGPGIIELLDLEQMRERYPVPT